MQRVRLYLLAAGVLVATTGVLAAFLGSHAEAPVVTVYKSPTCGCCAKWVQHLEQNGFKVKVVDMPDVSPVKSRFGIPEQLTSCHTGVVDRYVVEGHVPADLVHQMLEEKPDVTGLAVPGMPMGSPGMEGDYSEPYDIIAFTEQGEQRVYASR